MTSQEVEERTQEVKDLITPELLQHLVALGE
ncbi:hypothetical protein LCGC14_2702590, partial [marine sediment metagenome]